ncbi:MAG: WD40 repeat domain-containing protein [Tolypothrix sp. Co-bin9]|nr:WD40 repeat domain-containing protein [Tolypothrix sp. Co-bin9]
MAQQKNNQALKSLMMTLVVGGVATLAISSFETERLRSQTLSNSLITKNQVQAALREVVWEAINRNYDVSYSRDSKTTANGSGNKTAKLSVAFSPDGKTLATTSTDKTVKLWSSDGRLLQTLEGHQNEVTSVSFSPDGQMIASASSDNSIKLWDITSSKLKTSYKFNTVKNLSLQRVCSDGKIIASANDNKSIQIWQAYNKTLRTITWRDALLKDDILSVSANCQNIAAVGNDGTVRIWNLDGRLQHTFNNSSSQIEYVSFSADEKILTSVNDNNTIKVLDLKGQELKSFKTDRKVNSIKSSPDNKTVAIANEDSTVELRNFDDGKLIDTFTGNSNKTDSIDFSPDSKTIAIGCNDDTVKIFRTDNGKHLHTFPGARIKIEQVNFNLSGDILTSLSDQKIIKEWDLNNPLTYIEANLKSIVLILAIFGFGIIFVIQIKRLQNKQNSEPSKSKSSYIVTGWMVYVLPEDCRGNLEALRSELITAQKPNWYVSFITVLTLLDMLRGGIQIKLENFLDGKDEMAVIGRQSINKNKNELANQENVNVSEEKNN